MTIVERMFDIMDKNSLKSIDLAYVLHINKSVVSAWKKRNTNPPAEYLVQICRFIGVSLNYLITGNEVFLHNNDESINYLHFESTSQKIDYRRRVLHIKDDFIQERFREAREAADISLEDAAASAYIEPPDLLNQFEETGEIDLKKISLIQMACLAYKYDADLYWLICGKVRPPAAVVQDSKLAYPPYEFMVDSLKDTSEAPQQLSDNKHLSNEQAEMLLLYDLLNDDGKWAAQRYMRDYLRDRQKIYDPNKINEGGTA